MRKAENIVAVHTHTHTLNILKKRGVEYDTSIY